jgi:predicted SnoaL-like aldol condensation-catalyzing enzyme
MKAFKLFFSVIVFAALLTACNNGDSSKADTPGNDSADGRIAEDSKADQESKQEETNKQIARDFIQSLYGDKDSTAIDKYIADDIKQHDPILQDGKQWVRAFLVQLLKNPNFEKTKPDIKQISADGDMVWTLIREVAPNGKVFARVEIFRIENNKIQERWLVSQPEPKTSANKNTMF